MRTNWLIGLAAILGGWLPCSPSAAQDLPTATILTTQVTGVDAGEGAAFDRTLRSRIDALNVVRTEGAVALDLEQIQLALGCMGETSECLTAVARETQSRLVVVPSLAQAGGTVQATILVFDDRDQSMRRGTREVPATDGPALLGSVEGLLREVFGLPAAETHEVPDAPPAARATAPGLAVGPFVVIAGVGVAALVAGAIVGGLALADASTFQGATLDSARAVDDGLAVLSRQRTEAFAADGLLIGGAVWVVGGVIWALVAGREDGSSPLAMTPMLGTTQVGLLLEGSFGGAL